MAKKKESKGEAGKYIPYCFYLWYQKKLEENFGNQQKVSRKDAMAFLHKYKIPKQLWPVIMEEMRVLGLVKYVDRLHLQITNLNKNFVHNVSKMLLDMGVEPK